jgi:hypothetical protein
MYTMIAHTSQEFTKKELLLVKSLGVIYMCLIRIITYHNTHTHTQVKISVKIRIIIYIQGLIK